MKRRFSTWFPSESNRPRVDGPTFVAPDHLGRFIQDAIDQLMCIRGAGRLSRKAPHFDSRRSPRYEGFCARACEAYLYLLRDPRTGSFGSAGAEPRYVKHSEVRGDSHYWIQSSDGVMDLNFAPDEKPDSEYCDYQAGRWPTRTNGFRPWELDVRYPRNAEARRIMDTVWARLEQDSPR
jgi:hypothetical protein